MLLELKFNLKKKNLKEQEIYMRLVCVLKLV